MGFAVDDLGELLAGAEEDRHRVPGRLLDRLREASRVVALPLGREDDVAALQVRLHVGVAEGLDDRPQVPPSRSACSSRC